MALSRENGNILCELTCKLLKGGCMGEHIGEYSRGFKGDTRSIDYGSYWDYMGMIFPYSLLRTSKIMTLF